MELDEVSVGVCVDIAVDRAVNLFAVLDQAASRFADRGAVYRGERRVCARRELRDRALRLATSIRQQEGTGDHVAIASHNRLEFVELMFAIWATECVVSQVCASSTIGAELTPVTTRPTEPLSPKTIHAGSARR